MPQTTPKRCVEEVAAWLRAEALALFQEACPDVRLVSEGVTVYEDFEDWSESWRDPKGVLGLNITLEPMYPAGHLIQVYHHKYFDKASKCPMSFTLPMSKRKRKRAVQLIRFLNDKSLEREHFLYRLDTPRGYEEFSYDAIWRQAPTKRK